jgi:hypothetical protein
MSDSATLERKNMQATLFLPMIHSEHLDQPAFRDKLRAAIIDALGHCDIRFENNRAKQFPIRFRYRPDPQPRLVIEGEILTSGYLKDFYQGGMALAIQETFRERILDKDIPRCELHLSITMRVTLVL